MDRSFNILATEYRPMVVCYLKAFVGDAHVAEDLAQETFMAAHASLERFEEGGAFGAWLRGIARHKALDHQRKSARLPLVFDTHVVEGMEEVFTLFHSINESYSGGFIDAYAPISWSNHMNKFKVDPARTVQLPPLGKNQQGHRYDAPLGDGGNAIQL